MNVKILIADDHPVVGRGIEQIVSTTNIKVAGTLELPETIFDQIKKKKIQVLVTDIRVGGHDMFRLLENHSATQSGCRILFFSENSNPTSLARANSIECFDYLLKTAPPAEIVEAILKAAAGIPTPETSLLKKASGKIRDTGDWDQINIPLTQREKQVLQHVALGLSNREIGRSLGISVETVKEHVQNILRKLEANDRTQAAVWAVRNGLVP